VREEARGLRSEARGPRPEGALLFGAGSATLSLTPSERASLLHLMLYGRLRMR